MNEKRLQVALERLQKQASVNAPYGSKVGAELEYAQAYDEQVRRGTKPKLRVKYRRPS